MFRVLAPTAVSDVFMASSDQPQIDTAPSRKSAAPFRHTSLPWNRSACCADVWHAEVAPSTTANRPSMITCVPRPNSHAATMSARPSTSTAITAHQCATSPTRPRVYRPSRDPTLCMPPHSGSGVDVGRDGAHATGGMSVGSDSGGGPTEGACNRRHAGRQRRSSRGGAAGVAPTHPLSSQHILTFPES